MNWYDNLTQKEALEQMISRLDIVERVDLDLLDVTSDELQEEIHRESLK